MASPPIGDLQGVKLRPHRAAVWAPTLVLALASANGCGAVGTPVQVALGGQQGGSSGLKVPPLTGNGMMVQHGRGHLRGS